MIELKDIVNEIIDPMISDDIGPKLSDEEKLKMALDARYEVEKRYLHCYIFYRLQSLKGNQFIKAKEYTRDSLTTSSIVNLLNEFSMASGVKIDKIKTNFESIKKEGIKYKHSKFIYSFIVNKTLITDTLKVYDVLKEDYYSVKNLKEEIVLDEIIAKLNKLIREEKKYTLYVLSTGYFKYYFFHTKYSFEKLNEKIKKHRGLISEIKEYIQPSKWRFQPEETFEHIEKYNMISDTNDLKLLIQKFTNGELSYAEEVIPFLNGIYNTNISDKINFNQKEIEIEQRKLFNLIFPPLKVKNLMVKEIINDNEKVMEVTFEINKIPYSYKLDIPFVYSQDINNALPNAVMEVQVEGNTGVRVKNFEFEKYYLNEFGSQIKTINNILLDNNLQFRIIDYKSQFIKIPMEMKYFLKDSRVSNLNYEISYHDIQKIYKPAYDLNFFSKSQSIKELVNSRRNNININNDGDRFLISNLRNLGSNNLTNIAGDFDERISSLEELIKTKILVKESTYSEVLKQFEIQKNLTYDKHLKKIDLNGVYILYNEAIIWNFPLLRENNYEIRHDDYYNKIIRPINNILKKNNFSQMLDIEKEYFLFINDKQREFLLNQNVFLESNRYKNQ